MDSILEYKADVNLIKNAIIKSQYEAVKGVNEKQLQLYYVIGKYISQKSRNGSWGTGAIDAISKQLQKELPGLRGFSSRNLRNMRIFYEEWDMLDFNVVDDNNTNLAVTTAKSEIMINGEQIWQLQLPNLNEFSLDKFVQIGFTLHTYILSKVKDLEARIFYINLCADANFSTEELKKAIVEELYIHRGKLPNNFMETISSSAQAFKAINTFKDEYLLDYINVEELGIRDSQDIDERVIENAIVNNVKNFIMTFGKDFTFVRNQFHLDAFGEDQYIDLLFFNRELNCLVAVELKTGKFKTSYLGQLSGYLSVLDQFEKKEHENPSVGIILCKDMNKSFVDFVIRDYNKPMGVATYKTSKEMSDELKRALPDIDALRHLLEKSDE